MSLRRIISRFPIEIQLLIDQYYNEYREYYGVYVLPNIPFTNRILNYYNRTDEFIYLKITNKRKKHFIININKTITILKDMIGSDTLNEFELSYVKIMNNVKVGCNIWIRINATEMIHQNGGNTNQLKEFLYINKYNYNQFAIKISTMNLYGGNNCDIYVVEPLAHIFLPNHCNYYAAFNFQHLPESAINLIG
jgi:hypothetical protein